MRKEKSTEELLNRRPKKREAEGHGLGKWSGDLKKI